MRFSNRSGHCLSIAEVEITLIYSGSSFKERHPVQFESILGPGEEQYEEVMLRRKTKENGAPLILEHWPLTKAWGFDYDASDRLILLEGQKAFF